jgi:ubiquinone biosynthesis protein Coq4
MLLERLRTRIVSMAIRDSIPLINLVRRPIEPWPPLAELRNYPEKSLGREVAAFLDARGVPFLDRYEPHDTLHVLLEYDTSLRGELQLQAFMWGSGSSSPAGRILFVWGGLMAPEHLGAMRRALARGRRSRRMDERRLRAMLAEPSSVVRAELLA